MAAHHSQKQSGFVLPSDRFGVYTAGMIKVLDEIASQPRCWREAVARASSSQEMLPQAGESVAIIGCGTSLFMSQAFAAARESHGLGVSDAFPASEMRSARHYDRVVAISRSGTTTEVVRALQEIGSAAPTAVMASECGSPATSYVLRKSPSRASSKSAARVLSRRSTR